MVSDLVRKIQESIRLRRESNESESSTTNQEIIYPEIPVDFQGEICPYYDNNDCKPVIEGSVEFIGFEMIQADLQNYCPCDYRNCDVYKSVKMSLGENPLGGQD